MPCFHPISAWQSVKAKANGKSDIVFSMPHGDGFKQVNLPCGQCIGCRLERSRQWATRCVHEASLHRYNCYLTLTYDDEHIWWSKITGEQTLNPDDFTKFMKRLRKAYPNDRIRYFQCGEYGDETHRPHHHAILFGFDFPDKVAYSVSALGFTYYVSPSLNRLWGNGFCIIADVSFDSCAYVARYVLKKLNGELAKEKYEGIHPEYVTMSRRPGIGSEWLERYESDVYPYDEVVLHSNGKTRRLRPPRYYDKLYSARCPAEFEKIKAKRIERAKVHEAEMYDMARMADREKHKNITINKRLKRSL